MHDPTALIPVRLTPGAKSRLAGELGPSARVALMRRLFDGVVDALRDAGLRVIALSPTPIETDVEVWPDSPGGLNACVDAAVSRLSGPWLVVHADLPAITTADVARLLSEPGDVVVARACDGGTNALLLRSPMPTAFGPGSALAHARRARAAGLRCRVIDLPGLALDVDGPQTLARSGLR